MEGHYLLTSLLYCTDVLSNNIQTPELQDIVIEFTWASQGVVCVQSKKSEESVVIMLSCMEASY